MTRLTERCRFVEHGHVDTPIGSFSNASIELADACLRTRSRLSPRNRLAPLNLAVVVAVVTMRMV